MSFQNFLKNEGRGSVFFHKKGGVGKIGGSFKKKGGTLSLIFTLSNPFQWESEWWFVFCLYPRSICILCVPWEELSLIESSKQICNFYNFYKSVTFKKQRQSGTR